MVFTFRIILALVCALPGGFARAADAVIQNPHFLGAQSCKSSSCHGGGVDKGQHITWVKKDNHNARALAILGDARSLRMAEALGIGDPQKSARCTVCHSPMHALPLARLAKNVTPDAGVSCETCHGPAENWLLSHTRRDVSHEQRIAMGMREARDLYGRANVCIACHHMLDKELIEVARHPQMYFELDGQTEKQPPHWADEGTWLGPRAWLTGQAAALREISWKLTSDADPKLIARWKALVWLLRKSEAGASLPQSEDFAAMQAASDRLARTASAQQWSKDSTLRLLKLYAGLGDEFRGGKVDPTDLRRRGEVLLFPLDRLWSALRKEAKLESENFDKALLILKGEAERQDAFDPLRYAGALQSLEVELELLSKS